MSDDPAKAELLARRPRSHRSFTEAEMERLYALYYDRSVSIDRVAANFDVPGSTLLRWLAEMDWPKRRAMAQASFEATTSVAGPSVRGRRLDLDDLLVRTAAQAQREYRAVRAPRRGQTMEDRERTARLLASLSRTIERLDRSLAIRGRQREEEECKRWHEEANRPRKRRQVLATPS